MNKNAIVYLLAALPAAAVLAQQSAVTKGPSNSSSGSPTTQPSAPKAPKASDFFNDFMGGGDDGGGGGGGGFGGGGGGFPGGGLGGRGGFGGGFGGGRGGFGAAPQPNLPKEYEVLGSKCIFARDRRPAASSVVGGPGAASDAALAFRGAAVEDGEYVAFIEDTNRHDTRRVHVGDRVGTGRCTDISLDSIKVQENGQDRQVAIGYNLAGEPAIVIASTQPSLAGPGGPGAGVPFGAGGFGRFFNGQPPSPEMIERFRQMRDQRRRDGGGAGNGGERGGGRRRRDSSGGGGGGGGGQ